ncbi:MAG: hypothetical protein ACK4WC_10820, partial [Rubrimonas sp.]
MEATILTTRPKTAAPARPIEARAPDRPAAAAPRAALTERERDQRMALDVARRAALAAAPRWPQRGGQPPLAIRG